jgi:hypothetical protein
MHDADFPAYVPHEVRAHARTILRFCEEFPEKADSAACLRRLIWDSRMKEAYRILADAFFEDEDGSRQRKIDILVTAAWAARADYSKYRENLNLAVKLNKKIAGAASTLANLIREFRETGVNGPMEFDSISNLLRVTDHHNPYSIDAVKWGVLGHLVCGDGPWIGVPEDGQTQESGRRSITPEFVFDLQLHAGERTEIDPATRMCLAAGYAWSAAPDVPALLEAISSVAQLTEPPLHSVHQRLRFFWMRASAGLDIGPFVVADLHYRVPAEASS